MAACVMNGNPIILYGKDGKYQDITILALCKCFHDGILNIPRSDNIRPKLFGDPIVGTLKHIRIITQTNDNIYDANTAVKLNIEVKGYNIFSNPKWWYDLIPSSRENPVLHLNNIRQHLTCVGGNIEDESPLHLIIIQYVNENAKVLELGGNIGRTSLIISSILKNQKNLVTLEPDPHVFSHLRLNKLRNKFIFNIENAALSKKPLFIKNLETYFDEDSRKKGASEIQCITYEQLQEKYSIEFDTLVVDCEGAFYYIIKDDSDILKNITTLIMKNTYWIKTHKDQIDDLVIKYGFVRVYNKEGGNLAWGPCYNMFYEVWIKQQ